MAIKMERNERGGERARRSRRRLRKTTEKHICFWWWDVSSEYSNNQPRRLAPFEVSKLQAIFSMNTLDTTQSKLTHCILFRFNFMSQIIYRYSTRARPLCLSLSLSLLSVSIQYKLQYITVTMDEYCVGIIIHNYRNIIPIKVQPKTLSFVHLSEMCICVVLKLNKTKFFHFTLALTDWEWIWAVCTCTAYPYSIHTNEKRTRCCARCSTR